MLGLVVVLLAASPSLSEKLQVVSTAKVFVAHQSVGQNVLDGVSALALQGFVRLNLEHAVVGRDGSPVSKLDEVASLLQKLPPMQVAMLELSHADIGADTDVDAFFALFKKRLEALQLKFPQTRFVVVTVGLTTVGRGLQGLIKNKLASGAFGERENVKRHLLNERLRGQYLDRLFDLATVESGGSGSEPSAARRGQGAKPDTDPGVSCSFEREGKTWPCLREDFTDDGSHLNAAGRKEAARAFVDAVYGAINDH